jgi:hypothetical protein
MLAAPQSHPAAQEHDEERLWVGSSRLHELFVLVEVVKGRRGFGSFSSLIEHGSFPMTPHSTAHRRSLLWRWRALLVQPI